MPRRKCWVDGCEDESDRLGMCSLHAILWDRLVRSDQRTKLRNATDRARHEFYTIKEPSAAIQATFGAKADCWVWKGSLNHHGYGLFSSKLAQELEIGQQVHLFTLNEYAGIDTRDDLHTDHLCRFRPCSNPDHLQRVSRQENIIRGVGFSGVNSRKTHCDSGHRFTKENTSINSEGHRHCRKCNRAANSEYTSRPEVKAARIEAYEPVTGVRGKGQYQAERDVCGEGHELEGDNLVLEKRKKKSGEITHIRRCRICMNAKNRKNHALRNSGEVAPGVKREDCVTSTEAAGILDIKPTYFTTFVRRADGFPEPIKKGSPNLYERMAVVAWQNEKAPTE